MSVTAVTSATFESFVLGSPVPVIIDFWAEWCGPCRSIAPAMEQVAARRGDSVRFCKVNVDEEPARASAFQVQSIPLVVGMKGSTVVTGDVGWKGLAALEALVDRTIAAVPAAPPKEVDVAGLKAALAAGGSVLDVRNPDETAGGRVPGALLIPLDDLQARLGELDRFKGRDLYVICKSGGRSAKAAQFLASQGHQPINVAGGTMDWIAQGNDVQRG